MGDFIVIATLLTFVIFIVFKMIKDKKTGKKCSCGCGDCVFKDSCHTQNKK